MASRSSSVRDPRALAAVDTPVLEQVTDSPSKANPAEFADVTTTPDRQALTEAITQQDPPEDAAAEFSDAGATEVEPTPLPADHEAITGPRRNDWNEAVGFDDSLPTQVAERRPKPSDFDERSTAPGKVNAGKRAASPSRSAAPSPAAPPRAPSRPAAPALEAVTPRATSRPSLSATAAREAVTPRASSRPQMSVLDPDDTGPGPGGPGSAPYPPAASYASLPTIDPSSSAPAASIRPSSTRTMSSQRIPVLPWSPAEGAPSSSSLKAIPGTTTAERTGSTVAAGPRAAVPPPRPSSLHRVAALPAAQWSIQHARKRPVKWVALALAAACSAWLGALVGRGPAVSETEPVVPAPAGPQVQVMPLPAPLPADAPPAAPVAPTAAPPAATPKPAVRSSREKSKRAARPPRRPKTTRR